MDLRKLRYILALHEEGSFVKAAARVHLTQSALSRSVQALEAELGLVLFDRSADGVRATAAGRQFVARARHVAQVLSGFQHDMRTLHTGATGELSFGIGPFPAAAFLEDALVALARDCPALRLSVDINKSAVLLEHLMAERIEFLIAEVSTLAGRRDISIAAFGRQAGVLCCRAGHALAGQVPDHAALERYGYMSVHLPAHARLPPLLMAAAEGAPRQALACDNLAILKQLALRSDRLLLSTRACVHTELEAGTLVELPLPDVELPSVEMGVVSLRERSLSPAALAAIERLRAASKARELAPRSGG